MIETYGFILVPSIFMSVPSYQNPSSMEAFNPFLCGKACGQLPECGGFYWNNENVSYLIFSASDSTH